MGRIRILSDQVANQIAAGEVVDRPASVVKELLENALDAGASRIRVEVEAGGRKLIRMSDDGTGMNRDDALLAFERHATSKLRTADDLLSIATLGFRGEALASIASVARVQLETATGDEQTGTRLSIAGGKILFVEDAALTHGTTIAISDLFFNTPARRKFLRAESTELQHVTALVTHYALVYPEKHFELISSSHTLLMAPPVERTAERIYQIFGKDTLAQLLPVAAELQLQRPGLPEPPPWKQDPDEPKSDPGMLRLSGFFSKPELQKLNRNSIYIFVNKRLIRDRLLLHAITEAYRNVIPPTSFPVVLLFFELPPEEVDVNVHPAKTEVRFRQQSNVHDFVRDSLRMALIKARPAATFLGAIDGQPTASPSLMPPPASALPDSDPDALRTAREESESFELTERSLPPSTERLPFRSEGLSFGQTGGGVYRSGPAAGVGLSQNYPAGGGQNQDQTFDLPSFAEAATRLFQPYNLEGQDENGQLARSAATALPVQQVSQAEAVEADRAASTLHELAFVRPLGQLKNSFILATGEQGLWIIDQHVAHERILFEKIMREREVEQVQRQRLLMPLLVDLKPDQMIIFAQIAEELVRNGFEVEPFGPHTLAVKAAPVGLEGAPLERMLADVIDQTAEGGLKADQQENMAALRARIAASMACHAAIKVNMALDLERMEWLLKALATTEHPTSCPHGRPIALLYSWKEILKAFHRI